MGMKHKILKSYVVDFFKEKVVAVFGKDAGDRLHIEHTVLCLEYAKQFSDVSKKEEQHYFEQILPFIAAYKVMQGYNSEKADEVLSYIIEKRSKQASLILRTLLKIPGLYKRVPKICDGLITKSFCEEAGFQYGKIECSKTEWKADIVKCPYRDTCEKLGCIEIAHYFCDSDDMIYGNLHKKILWKRTTTLGRGDNMCDFNVEIVK